MRKIIILLGLAAMFIVSPTYAIIPGEQPNAVVYDPGNVVSSNSDDQVVVVHTAVEMEMSVPSSFEYDLASLL